MRRLSLLLAMLLGLMPAIAMAGDFGTEAEAVALVGKAIAYAKQVGLDKALVEFSAPKGRWVDRDLYLVVLDKAGDRIAHGQNPRLIGVSLFDSIDINGKEYGKELEGAIKAGKTSGWLEYFFSDPRTKKQAAKKTYWEKSGDSVFLCGVYIR